MKVYEGMFLVDPKTLKKGASEAPEIVQSVLEKVKAKIRLVGKWDERRLAYNINNQNRGIYVLAYFECGGAELDHLNREVALMESILRILVLEYEGEVPSEISLKTEEEYTKKEKEPEGEVVAGAIGGGDEVGEDWEKGDY